MKVLLINPPITKRKVYAKYSSGAPCLPPLGLCYLAAVLLKRGHQVKIIDCVAERVSLGELKGLVNQFTPRIVGVTATTVSYPPARGVLRLIKEIDSRIITVLGGAHISALPSATMEESEHIDIGVFGEGETTLCDIVDGIENRRSLAGIDGTLIHQNGKVIKNKPRNSTTSLDEIPFPARHLLKDLRLYSHTPFRGAKFTTTMVTSRGCPFRCGYCDQSIFGHTWRYHSADYVISEMVHLKEQYNVDFISFEDDNFLLSKKRAIDLCRMVIAEKVNVAWSCLGRANEVDHEVLSLMKKAGCRTIYVGVESGSAKILRLMNKQLSIETIRKGIELIKQHGISVTGSFILGVPTETTEDIKKTLDLALSLPLDGASFFIFTPYPNTKLRELAFEHGTVSERWSDYSGHPTSLPFIPDGMDEDYLLTAQATAYRKFLLRPGYLLKHIGIFTNTKALRNGFHFVKNLLVPTIG